ncbi:MAG: hypothetical protein ACK4ZU_01195 [Allorhizobium sp.]
MAESISSQQELSKTADSILLENILKSPVAADYIGFLVFQATKDLDAALAARQAVMDGEGFSVSTTQVAAQTKSLSEAQGATDINGNPTATFTIGGQPYDISSILKTEVYYWSNTTGAGKKAETTYHLREVFDTVGSTPPDKYSPTWYVQNTAPTATAITESAVETQSTFTNHIRDNGNVEDVLEVDLLRTAIDPDKGDTLSVLDLVFKLDDVEVELENLPSYITVTGGTVFIDQNSRDLDSLPKDAVQTLTVEYKITDGKAVITNSATITITGTSDEWKGTESDSIEATHFRSDFSSNGGGNANFVTLSVVGDPDIPADAFNFTGISITATATGLTDNQKIKISDGGADDWGDTLDLRSTGATATTELVAGALNDGKIDYNLTFVQADPNDSVTVRVDYQYDYWYTA